MATSVTGGATPAKAFSFDNVVGQSPELREVIDVARAVANAHASTVLLIGETGTGKEMFARGIHYEGRNSAAPFVAVNCAAIPDTLLESELFGHEAGAFTGARVRKLGLMELAGCGTMFLDEIHHLPPHLQPKLLRALEERRLRRLGGSQEIEIECRVIATTNVAIERAVEEGSFREDLFYRLNVLRVEIPPLRTRRGDVEILARHFLATFSREYARPAKRLAPDAIAALRGHAWPGNVRELKNVLERAYVLSGASEIIGSSHLLIQRRVARATLGSGAPLAGEIEYPLSGKTMRQVEREAAVLALKAAGGNQSKAAKILGISRPTVARLLREMETPGSDVVEVVEEAS